MKTLRSNVSRDARKRSLFGGGSTGISVEKIRDTDWFVSVVGVDSVSQPKCVKDLGTSRPI